MCIEHKMCVCVCFFFVLNIACALHRLQATLEMLADKHISQLTPYHMHLESPSYLTAQFKMHVLVITV